MSLSSSAGGAASHWSRWAVAPPSRNIQCAHVVYELGRLLRRQKNVDFRAPQDRADFFAPQQKCKSCGASGYELVKNAIGVSVVTAVETPSHRHRVVENELTHVRPWI